MPEAAAETHRPREAAPAGSVARRAWRLRAPRLGIGWRLILGLTAVAAVLIAAQVLATRTTREALDAVRSMQNEHEPLASAANLVLEKLVAYDRAVGEYVQARSAADFSSITAAGAALEGAITAYFRSAPASVPPAAVGLRVQLIRHIAVARQLASRAAQRLQWVDERQAALSRVYERIASAGGSGLAINGTQVVARRSLSELESAINAVRGNFDTSAVIARRERDFMAVLDAHVAEFENSPGRAWLTLVRHDFQAAARLRLQIERYDEQRRALNGTASSRTAPRSPRGCRSSCSVRRARDCCRRRSMLRPRPRWPSTRCAIPARPCWRCSPSCRCCSSAASACRCAG